MSKSIVDPSARRFGRVTLGAGAIVESNVVLGHPSAREVLERMSSIASYSSVDDFYDSLECGETVIGANAIIRSGSVIYAGAAIGARFDCGHNVVVRERAQIGDAVYLKNNTEIMSGVRIGMGCRIAGVVADDTVLGDRVSSFGCLTHVYRSYVEPAHNLADSSVLPRPAAAPVIGDDVIVGRGAVIIGGVTVGAGARIGPNAVVSCDVPPGARIGPGDVVQ